MTTAIALEQALEVAIPGNVDYLKDRFQIRLDKDGLTQQYQALLNKFSELDAFYKAPLADDRKWSGEVPLSPSDLARHKKAEDALQKIGEHFQDILATDVTMDIAINDQAQMARAYSIAGKPLSDDASLALDTLLGDWLAKQNVVIQDGALYEKGENRDILVDKQGQPVRSDAERIKGLLNDPEKGLASYMANENIQIKTVDQPFPEEITTAPAAKS